MVLQFAQDLGWFRTWTRFDSAVGPDLVLARCQSSRFRTQAEPGYLELCTGKETVGDEVGGGQ